VKYWITVSRGACPAGSESVATTSDPELVVQVLRGLCRNRLLEDDRLDRAADPDFYTVAQVEIEALTERIRAEACLCGKEEAV
jgi:hypothetical protein